MGRLTQQIKDQALELGFQKVGICPAEAPNHLTALSDWLDRGCHGTMQWMARTREKRLDIGKVLPGVKSVVVLGLNYYSSQCTQTVQGPGRISRYAQGVDYHDILQVRLRKLDEFVHHLKSDAASRTYVDTGPVAEKTWAEAAGLGWQGKHSNLLTQDYSSWLLLGVLLLDFELDYDEPAPNHCGTCVRCIEACPTQAITEPYVVDSRLCISYLNIELRGAIPEEFRSGMGDWIFGCDVCQDVCPWNRFTKESEETAFLASRELRSEDLSSWLALSLDEFGGRFRHSAIMRARWKGFLRNVTIAMGNTGDSRFGPPLTRALHHEESLVRGHAAWALGQIRWEKSLDSLKSRWVLERDPWVCREITAAIHTLSSLDR